MDLGRSQNVLGMTGSFARTMTDVLSFENLKDFASNAEDRVHEKSRKYTKHYMGDERILTDHADHIRTIIGKIKRLRDEVIPKLQLAQGDRLLHVEAVCLTSFIYAEMFVMDCMLHD